MVLISLTCFVSRHFSNIDIEPRLVVFRCKLECLSILVNVKCARIKCYILHLRDEIFVSMNCSMKIDARWNKFGDTGHIVFHLYSCYFFISGNVYLSVRQIRVRYWH